MPLAVCSFNVIIKGHFVVEVLHKRNNSKCTLHLDYVAKHKLIYLPSMRGYQSLIHDFQVAPWSWSRRKKPRGRKAVLELSMNYQCPNCKTNLKNRYMPTKGIGDALFTIPLPINKTIRQRVAVCPECGTLLMINVHPSLVPDLQRLKRGVIFLTKSNEKEEFCIYNFVTNWWMHHRAS